MVTLLSLYNNKRSITSVCELAASISCKFKTIRYLPSNFKCKSVERYTEAPMRFSIGLYAADTYISEFVNHTILSTSCLRKTCVSTHMFMIRKDLVRNNSVLFEPTASVFISWPASLKSFLARRRFASNIPQVYFFVLAYSKTKCMYSNVI